MARPGLQVRARCAQLASSAPVGMASPGATASATAFGATGGPAVGGSTALRLAGFRFSYRHGQLQWRLLHGIDPDAVVRPISHGALCARPAGRGAHNAACVGVGLSAARAGQADGREGGAGLPADAADRQL